MTRLNPNDRFAKHPSTTKKTLVDDNDNDGDNALRGKKDADNIIISNAGHAISNNITNNDDSGNTNNNGIDAFLQRLDDDVDIRQMKKNKEKSMHPPSSRSSVNNNDEVEGGTDNITKVVKKVTFALSLLLMAYLAYDAVASPPEARLLGTKRINAFLLWVRDNPILGGAAFVLAYATCVVLLLPGTPLTLGCGYAYKVSYGWTLGLAIGTALSTSGSLLGSVTSFLLGRFVLRDKVRDWGRRHYPLFDVLDGAVSDNGFKIMALLYLTPILPLGPVSYVCGTTSMPLVKFAGAKIACVPLMLLYTFIGASTDTFFTGGSSSSSSNGATDLSITATTIIENDTAIMTEEGSNGGSANYNAGSGGGGVDDETHRKMVLFGLLLSIVSMSIVSYFVKKELYKIFDQQKREKKNKDDDDDDDSRHHRRESSSSSISNSSNNNNNNSNVVVGDVEMRRRPRGQAEDIEKR